jgi:predicted SnoaL-like aldol condensation-catalyzing enzyme
MQQGERNRNTVLRFFNEVMALGSLEVLDELAVDDYEDHGALPGQGPGRAGLKQRVATIRAAFEPRKELHDVIVDGDRVAVRWTLRGDPQRSVHRHAGHRPIGRVRRRSPLCDARRPYGGPLERRWPMGVLPAGWWRGQGPTRAC